MRKSVSEGSNPDMPVFSQFRAWQGGFRILKRLFFNKADKIPPLTRSGYRHLP